MLLSAIASLALSAPPAGEFVQTPGGLVHESCIHSGVSGYNVSSCPYSAPVSNRQIYAMDVHAFSSGEFTSFTADWTVPKLPSRHENQIVYFWPGFKSQQPEMGLPVLQPVLQYGQHGAKWQLQSWFVHGGAVTGDAIEVSPGDKITSFMRLDGTEWTVSGTDTTTGETSTLKISKEKIGNKYKFDWAMMVCETIKTDGACAALPADDAGVTFTNVTVDGKKLAWIERENLADCKENVTSLDGGDVIKMTWSHTA